MIRLFDNSDAEDHGIDFPVPSCPHCRTTHCDVWCPASAPPSNLFF